jgi:hypothetical protein
MVGFRGFYTGICPMPRIGLVAIFLNHQRKKNYKENIREKHISIKTYKITTEEK